MAVGARDERLERDTPWRQGHLLPLEHSSLLNNDETCRHIVISHDCDLASDEAIVEVISVTVHEGDPHGSLKFGENPRILHLAGELDGKEVYLALRQSDKCRFEKSELEGSLPEQAWKLSDRNQRLLQEWLACRYQRHALPNALNDRLRIALDKLKNAAKSRHASILAVFISYDPDDEIEIDDKYELDMAIVYQSQSFGAQEHAEQLAEKFRTALKDVPGVDCPKDKVKTYSDTSFTLFDMTRMIKLRLEFLSFRGETVGTMLEG